MQQTIGDIICVTLHTNPPKTIYEANKGMDNALLVTCMHGTRCTVSMPIQTKTGALVYGGKKYDHGCATNSKLRVQFNLRHGSN